MSKSIRVARVVAALGLGVLLLGGYVVMVLRAPEVLLPPDVTSSPPAPGAPSTLTPAERLTAAHNARLLAISFGGALVVLAGLLYTARNYRLAHRGQVTDRFTKALERLNADELYVRIGGIHALEHVLRDSADHHADIVEVLVAFIRQRAPRARNDEDSPIHPRQPLPTEPEPDVQAALTALAHRPHRRERNRINLTNLHLQSADLTEARLEHANLSGARLEGVNLYEARLAWADLSGARLERANLYKARLEEANLARARLERANLSGARLERANLHKARLEGADLSVARLDGALLHEARLEGAFLHSARLDGAYLRGARLEGADLCGTLLEGMDGHQDDGRSA